jgi:hypothetical protein
MRSGTADRVALALIKLSEGGVGIWLIGRAALTNFDLKSRGVLSGETVSDKGEWSQTLGLEGIETIHVAHGS